MNEQQISKIKSLDKESCDGSIQNLLLRSDLSIVPYGDACFHIAQCLKNDKTALELERWVIDSFNALNNEEAK